MTSFQQAKFEIGLFLNISENLWTSRGLGVKAFQRNCFKHHGCLLLHVRFLLAHFKWKGREEKRRGEERRGEERREEERRGEERRGEERRENKYHFPSWINTSFLHFLDFFLWRQYFLNCMTPRRHKIQRGFPHWTHKNSHLVRTLHWNWKLI